MNDIVGFSFSFTNWLSGGTAPQGILFLEFLAGCIVVFFAGRSLTRSADAVGEKFGWGDAWVGLLMLATITSLPELVTNIGSITLAKAPDLAFGNIVGSCAFNIFIVFLMTLFYMRGRNAEGKGCWRSVLAEGSTQHIGSLVWGCVLIGLAIAGILFFSYGPQRGWLAADQANLYDWLFAGVGLTLVYLVGMRVLFRKDKAAVAAAAAEATEPVDVEIRKNPWPTFLVSAVLIVAAGIWLSLVGEQISKIKVGGAEIGGSLVGALLLGVATSLPEVVVTFSALRMGSVNLALGNVFGSNMFNIWIFSFSKLCSPTKPLFDRLTQDPTGAQLYSHVSIAGLAIVMSIIAMLGLTRRAQTNRDTFPWVGVLIGVLYLAGFAALFLLRGTWAAAAG